MIHDDKLVQALMQHGLLSPFMLNQARRIQKRTKRTLFQVILEHELVDEAKALGALGTLLPYPCVALSEFEGDPKVLALVPESVAQRFQVMPLGVIDEGKGRRLVVAMSDPTNLEALEAVGKASDLEPQPVLVGPKDLNGALERCYGIRTRPSATVIGRLSQNAEDFELDDGLTALPEDADDENASWDALELDKATDDYLKGLLEGDDDEDEPEDATVLSSPPATLPEEEFTETGSFEALYERRESSNVFKDFMRQSSVVLLRPPTGEAEQLEADLDELSLIRDARPGELLRSVVGILVRRGLISEKELAEELERRNKKGGDS
ncbi:MAG: hypothetical protein KC561_07320 [Myxococcales bacterium]|nr:hypothetical protein [Myxococcales bacterium]